jgi:hypothetical protein
MLSYKTQIEERADKRLLETLRVALNGAKASLRRDDCGLWILRGSRGHISTYGDGKGWQLNYVRSDGEASGSKQNWTWKKRRLASFCRLTQDGDDEGCFYLTKLPTPEEAHEIRDIFGIRPSPYMTTERLAALRYLHEKVPFSPR